MHYAHNLIMLRYGLDKGSGSLRQSELLLLEKTITMVWQDIDLVIELFNFIFAS